VRGDVNTGAGWAATVTVVDSLVVLVFVALSVNLYDRAFAVVLAGTLTGIDTGPELQPTDGVSPVIAGEEARLQLVAPETVAERVTWPPLDDKESGEATNPVTVGAGVAAAVDPTDAVDPRDAVDPTDAVDPRDVPATAPSPDRAAVRSVSPDFEADTREPGIWAWPLRRWVFTAIPSPLPCPPEPLAISAGALDEPPTRIRDPANTTNRRRRRPFNPRNSRLRRRVTTAAALLAG
jgi:hypothetical protein